MSKRLLRTNAGSPVNASMIRCTPGRTAGWTAPPPRGGGVGRACQVEQVRPLRLVELRRTGDGVQDTLGDAAEVAAFHAGVVLDADPGEHRDLAPAQTGHPTLASADHTGLLGGDPGAPRREKRAGFSAVVHEASVGALQRGWGYQL